MWHDTPATLSAAKTRWFEHTRHVLTSEVMAYIKGKPRVWYKGKEKTELVIDRLVFTFWTSPAGNTSAMISTLGLPGADTQTCQSTDAQ